MIQKDCFDNMIDWELEIYKQTKSVNSAGNQNCMLYSISSIKRGGGGLWQRKFKALFENKKSYLSKQAIATQVRIYLKNIKAVVSKGTPCILRYHSISLTLRAVTSSIELVIHSAAHAYVLYCTWFNTHYIPQVSLCPVYLSFLFCPSLISVLH